MAAFTTVAAGVGLATTAVTTGASFAQAGKQNRLRKEAEAEAEKAMAAARGRTEMNYFENLAIAKEAYNQAYQAGNVASAQAIQAIQEGDVRGVSAGVGGIEQASLQQADKVRAAQEAEILQKQKLVTQEDSRLRDINLQLDLQEVQGAQLAARDAQEAQNLAIEQGIAGVTSMGQQAMDFIPLFKKQDVLPGVSDKMVAVKDKAGNIMEGKDNVSWQDPGTGMPTAPTEFTGMTQQQNMGGKGTPLTGMEPITLGEGISIEGQLSEDKIAGVSEKKAIDGETMQAFFIRTGQTLPTQLQSRANALWSSAEGRWI